MLSEELELLAICSDFPHLLQQEGAKDVVLLLTDRVLRDIYTQLCNGGDPFFAIRCV